MTTHHTNICSNNCIYAKKVMWLSRAGTSEDWLYRCTKLEERVITTDSVIHEVGCATYTTTFSKSDDKADLIEKAEGLLKEINLKLEEDKKKKAETPVTPVVTEPIKPVEKIPEPVVVPAPVVIHQQEPTVQHIPSMQVTITEEPVKKKRGRKPKQVQAVEPQVIAPTVQAPVPDQKKEEVINDGGTTEGTKL